MNLLEPPPRVQAEFRVGSVKAARSHPDCSADELEQAIREMWLEQMGAWIIWREARECLAADLFGWVPVAPRLPSTLP